MSSGSVPARRSPAATARSTYPRKVLSTKPWVPSIRRLEPSGTVSMAGRISRLSATWSINNSIQARRAASGGMEAANRVPAAVSFSTSAR